MTEPVYAMQTAVNVVTERMGALQSTAQQYSSMLQASLASMANIRMGDVAQPSILPPPATPVPSIKVGQQPTFTPEALQTPADPLAPSIDSLLSKLDVGDMDALPPAPQMPALNLPAAPGMAAIPVPARPAIDTTVEIPAAPSVTIPEMEALERITLPAFEFPQLPDFDGQAPSVNFTAPNVFINWTEPVYDSELLPELEAKVRSMIAGGTGLPAPVEDALFGRARERDSAETQRAVQEAVDTWAARNFTMPPGMLAKQASVAREQGRMRAAELNRDILVEAAKWEIESIRFAVTQGIALEQLTASIYDNACKRLFEVARFQAEAQISVFNAQIGLFNAQNAAFQTLAQVYRTRLDGALAKLQAYKTAIDGQVALGQINQQRVEVFKAKIGAVQASVEVFSSLMRGAQVRADVIKNQFDAYRADVQAYAEQVGAEKAKFDAYDSQVKGELGKAGVFEANARAYASTIQGLASKADIKVKGAQLRMEAARVHIQKYQADTDSFKAKLQAGLNRVQYGTQVFQAQVDGWRAASQASISETEMQSRFADMNTRMAIAYSEMQMGQYNANINKAHQQAQIALEAAKAMGQYAAQLAAGAMSAMHVSANVSGSGSQSDSYSRSQSESTSTNHNYNY
ncbi:hypothetical protein A4F85_04585 [Delftia sp. GW456-R20]|uniref:hypothetical protein n=1 Tax=Delftia sp. GW456-R20 TaxID=1827145 RepID=UPI0007AEBF5C|nr:hypothetical protein [Delftia sp. GW456-R20]KZK31998.1 hypothetical protein A4F85_04585 [Delftia sp. GW456-R20]